MRSRRLSPPLSFNSDFFFLSRSFGWVLEGVCPNSIVDFIFVRLIEDSVVVSRDNLSRK